MTDTAQQPRTMEQANAYASPWSVWTRAKIGLWSITWVLLFRPTPKFCFPWRVFLLRLFGAKVSGRPFVAPSAIVKMPWNLVLEDRACLSWKSEVYNLTRVTLKARCTIAQEAYLCAGTHDFSTSDLPLVVAPITVGEDVFVGARAFVMPGVVIGDGAVVGACSVVTKDLPPWMICAGNPCRPIKPRDFVRKDH